MIIVTAANYRYKKIIDLFKKQVDKLNYESIIYDLGDLNCGKKFKVDDVSFQEKGYYCEINNSWKTKAIHKPKIIYDALNDCKKTIAYLDADAIIYKNLEEIDNADFDLSFTIRRKNELFNEPKSNHKIIMGNINAGVMFFKYSKKTMNFIESWNKLSQIKKNDQLALNTILNKKLPRCGFSFFNDLKILSLPTEIYNFYYFSEVYPLNVKIIHYKNNLWLNGQQYKNFMI